MAMSRHNEKTYEIRIRAKSGNRTILVISGFIIIRKNAIDSYSCETHRT